MAYLHRLIVAATLLVASFAALAIDCTQYIVGAQNSDGTGVYGQSWESSLEGAVQAYCAARSLGACYRWAPNGYIYFPCPVGGGECTAGYAAVNTRQANCGCESPLEEVNGECVCKPPKKWGPNSETDSTAVCMSALDADCGEKKGMAAGTVDADGLVSSGATVCDTGPPVSDEDAAAGRGCAVTFEKDFSYQDASGKWRTKGKATFKGGRSCLASTLPNGSPTVPTGSQTTSTTASPSTCSGYWGEVNGVQVCVPIGDVNTVKADDSKTKITTAPDGSTTTTSTVSSTHCEGGNCTTTSVQTTTTRNPSGSVTSSITDGTSTTSEPRNDFCQRNPKHPSCADGSAFAGSCTGGFTCTGDAALCAVAKAANEQKCLLDKPSPEAELYETVKTGTGTGIASQVTDITSASFNSTSDLGAGAGMADRIVTVSVSGTTRNITIPFSMVNPWLTILGNLMLTLAYLSAMAIVFRRG